MPERSVVHSTFTTERTYDWPPARVFAAWADPATKARWFAGGTGEGNYQLDFRVGGREVVSGGPPGGPVIITRAQGNPDLSARGTVNITGNTVKCSLTQTFPKPPPDPDVREVTAIGNTWSVSFGAKGAGGYDLECTAPGEPGDSIPIKVI